ncbi:hypothetical protein [Amycolatopsis sp. cmx-4-68]|uniref:hypothetical protein n=1 Tax=Amycolatopsis sp. cmx-4-68 TaxID=2790938 RepID=UPI00397CA1F0
MAVAFLPAELGASARLAVEIAFGADLTDVDGSGWSWTDVTADVRQDPGITTSGGRSDEASTSQPANCSMVLDNATGAYSIGGGSAHYPYVRRNVPVRVRVNPGDGVYRVVFQGYANGFTPGWTDTDHGRIPVVTLSASGVLRRLIQGKDPLRSALYRYFTITNSDHLVTPVEYWPLEEDKAATEAASAVDGGAPGQFAVITSGGKDYGKAAWGGDTDNVATARAVKVSAGGSLRLPCRPSLVTADYWVVQWSQRYTSGSGAWVDFYTNGPHKIRITFWTDGSIDVIESQSAGDTTRFSVAAAQPYTYDDVWRTYTFVVDQTTANTSWTLYRDGSYANGVTSALLARGLPTRLDFISVPSPGGTEDPVSVAHVGLIESIAYVTEHAWAGTGYLDEFPEHRATRLCEEEGVDLDLVGALTTDVGMGPQRPLPFVTLVREVEAVDQGVLYDGVGPGLRYVARDQRENATTDLAVSAADLVAPFEPTDDDQRDRNRVVATSATGAKASYEDTDGPRGTTAIGVYDSSVDPNVADTSFLLDYASWAVHLGTVEGYRYPAVTMNMRAIAAAALAADVLAVTPSSRITVSDVDTLAGLPDETVDLLAEGVSHKLSTREWLFTAKCSPYDPWIIGTVASETGDTDDDLLRLDTDGAFVTHKFVGTGAAAVGNNASVAPALPAGIAAGDLLLVFAAIRNSGAGVPSTPTGYTLLAGSANARVFGKIATGSESAPTVAFTGGVANATTLATMVAYRGAALTVQNSAEQLNASAQNIATPALSGVGTAALVMWFGWKQDDWTSVDPLLAGSIDEVFENSSTTGDDAGIVVDHLVVSSSVLGGGAVGTGAFTVTGGASAISRGIVLALDLATIPAGSTSLVVATPSGPLWTTTADDYPLELKVGGLPVTATACSGSSSPQTFTVQPTSSPRHAGDAVEVLHPRALGL